MAPGIPGTLGYQLGRKCGGVRPKARQSEGPCRGPEVHGLAVGPLTFGLAVLEGGGAFVLGEQPPATGETAGAPRLRLVRAQGTGLAWPEAVC